MHDGCGGEDTSGRSALRAGTRVWDFFSDDEILVEVVAHDPTRSTRRNRSDLSIFTSDPRVAVDYGYDADERLETVTDKGPDTGSTGKVTTYGYDIAGRMLGWVQPNGVATGFTYDSENHLTGVTVKDAASASLASYAYTLSATGNRLGVTEHGGRTIAWTYDSLYRLTSETVAGSAFANGVVGYTYDAAGNRLTRTSSVTGVPTSTTTYDANDRTVGDAWNDNGNMLTRDDRTRSFDSLDRLMSSAPTAGGTTVKVTYDGDGNRVAQEVGGVVTSYLLDDQNPTGYAQVVEERLAGVVTKAYVFGKKALSQKAKVAATWATSYYGMDGHGSVVLLTDGAGTVTDTWEYDAFGTVVARTGTTANTILYSGEWMDAEQGLQYLRARWYAPGMGRFVSADRWTGNSRRPASLARYAYVENGPLGLVDPTGYSGGSDTLVGLQAAATGVATLALNAAPTLSAAAVQIEGEAAEFVEASSVVVAELEAAGPEVGAALEGFVPSVEAEVGLWEDYAAAQGRVFVDSLAEKVANGHSYGKHVIQQGEFPSITSVNQFAELIKLSLLRGLQMPFARSTTADTRSGAFAIRRY